MASHLVESILALSAVCALAVVLLRWGVPRFGHEAGSRAALRVISRLRLEPRRSLLVVRVAERTLVLASSESGIALITELAPQEGQALETLTTRVDVSRETPGAST